VKLLGENRREAINRLQETLGPVTPRPLAEQTFAIMVKDGRIVEDNGSFLIEEDVTAADMRKTATAHVIRSGERNRGGLHHFNISSHNFVKARISNSWSAAMAMVFAPSLNDSLSKSINPDEDDE
jgi:hypothetical protein